MAESERKEKLTTCGELFRIWDAYAHRIDLYDTIAELNDFINGKQWPDNNVNNSIRVTLNFIADMIRKIASKINGTRWSLKWTSSDDSVDGSKIKRYDDFVLDKIGHRAFSLQSSINGENLGIEITYCGWDNDAPWNCGGFFDGGLFEQHIDPRNFAVDNPHEPNIQRQRWVMMWHDVYVKELFEKIDSEPLSKPEKERRKEKLRKQVLEARGSSGPSDQTKDKEYINEALVRVYTRFFRIKGEVCYEQCTDYVDLYAFPKPLSKICADNIAKAAKEAFEKRKEMQAEQGINEEEDDFDLVEDMKIDFAQSIISFDGLADEQRKRAEREKFSLYPFDIYVPKVVNNSIFGRSMTHELISLQKGVNYSLSSLLKAIENIAFNKVYVRSGAMASGETFSNDPEHNIQHDHYKGNGNGFYTLQTASMPAELFQFPDIVMGLAKNSYNASDFANGKMDNPETSGYAVEQMLRQANSPLEQEQMLFWQYQVNLARIRLMFYKHYVDERQYLYEMSDEEYMAEEDARKGILQRASMGQPIYGPDGTELPLDVVYKRYKNPTKREVIQRIKGSELFGHDFDIKTTAQQGLVPNELAEQQWYQQMFGNGGIQAYAENPDLLEFIIDTAPASVMPEERRASMKVYVKKMQASAIQQLKMQNQQLQQLLQQAVAYGKSQEEEFVKTLNANSAMLQHAQADAQAARKTLQEAGLSEGQIHSNNAKGMGATQQAAMASEQNLM